MVDNWMYVLPPCAWMAGRACMVMAVFTCVYGCMVMAVFTCAYGQVHRKRDSVHQLV
jgi:hypothetical protein